MTSVLPKSGTLSLTRPLQRFPRWRLGKHTPRPQHRILADSAIEVFSRVREDVCHVAQALRSQSPMDHSAIFIQGPNLAIRQIQFDTNPLRRHTLRVSIVGNAEHFGRGQRNHNRARAGGRALSHRSKQRRNRCRCCTIHHEMPAGEVANILSEAPKEQPPRLLPSVYDAARVRHCRRLTFALSGVRLRTSGGAHY